MAKEIADTIRKNAQGPAEVTGDSGSMRSHSLRHEIEKDGCVNFK